MNKRVFALYMLGWVFLAWYSGHDILERSVLIAYALAVGIGLSVVLSLFK